ncbi:amidase [Acinetobacter baumannii]|jgi:amidase|uniref:amidase n=1 Tax=Acinetobacter baumannii TaxID=470 RepID=UPI00066EB5C3|nr:amidase [Acinetobacter baumannii]KMV24661.1 amidase family protein [Acinetobacter baumannii]MBD0492832.1 amidase [Acinetobacter baumannii]MDC5244910.1 amidase [Acinetobacter baumannii]MDI9658023.1 amidase [Acinetobacter baumannii]MDI9668768.1 amidase [Acinetobacter baumannii]
MASLVQTLQLGSGKLKVVVKDTIDIENYPTRAASPALANIPVATQHAAVVKNILDQDCQIIGKANLHELAFGITGLNSYTGNPINPKYPHLIPGGSSSGSATSVAEKICDFSIGTDTGGSIRLPAACCGIYGLKPTFGRVSRQGVLPQFSSLDCVGPFANDMSTLIQAMRIIDSTFDIEKVKINHKHKTRIGILRVDADNSIWQSIEQRIEQLSNIEFEPVELELFQDAYKVGMTLISYENWLAFSYLISTGKLGIDIRQRLLASAQITFEEYEKAKEVQQAFRQEIDQLLTQFDALLLPTLPIIPPQISEVNDPLKLLNLTSLVRPFNVSGHPALTLPLETAEGLPVGLQLVAGQNQDEKLCAIACLFELNKGA